MFPGDEKIFKEEYAKYLEKFKKEFGDIDGFVKKDGFLIQKLSFEEFVNKFTEYKQLENTIEETVNNGATLIDVMYDAYREASAHVLMLPKKYI